MRHGSLKIDLSVLLTVVVVSLCSLVIPEPMENIKYYILGATMLLIGIPHGAIDHIVSSRIYKLDNTLFDQLKFYIPYLLLMLFMTLIWIFSSLVGFILFAIITIYHFGQADLEHLDFKRNIKPILIISRGLMILSLIIFSEMNYTFPIIEAATALQIPDNNWMSSNGFEFGIFLALQHPVLLLATSFQSVKNRSNSRWYMILDSFLIILIFLLNDPIIGFSLYFALWHSMGHVLEMKKFFNKLGESFSLIKFYKLAIPFTIISLAGLWLVYKINQAFGIEEQMVALLFILISVLTLPHVLVVQKMLNVKAGSVD